MQSVNRATESAPRARSHFAEEQEGNTGHRYLEILKNYEHLVRSWRQTDGYGTRPPLRYQVSREFPAGVATPGKDAPKSGDAVVEGTSALDLTNVSTFNERYEHASFPAFQRRQNAVKILDTGRLSVYFCWNLTCVSSRPLIRARRYARIKISGQRHRAADRHAVIPAGSSPFTQSPCSQPSTHLRAMYGAFFEE
jgi:hypothetical protein